MTVFGDAPDALERTLEEALPRGVQVQEVIRHASGIEVVGRAPSVRLVAIGIRSLSRVPQFRGVALKSLRAELDSPGASPRFQSFRILLRER